MVTGSKACTKCGQVKLFTEYSKDNRATTGTQSACKCCQAEIRKERKDKDKEVQSLWRKNNAQRVKDTNKKYAQQNKEKRLIKARERYKADPEKMRNKSATYRALNHDELLTRLRARTKDERENLKPRYVAKVLQMKMSEVPETLMRLKAEHLEVVRLLRPLKKQLRKLKDESSQNTY